ncbi:MAG: hypothetical protein KGM42_01150 [Hyphomicrobiales bacterium]|nr:hypothetical protein [Hyphomicrobiales bacterium]
MLSVFVWCGAQKVKRFACEQLHPCFLTKISAKNPRRRPQALSSISRRRCLSRLVCLWVAAKNRIVRLAAAIRPAHGAPQMTDRLFRFLVALAFAAASVAFSATHAGAAPAMHAAIHAHHAPGHDDKAPTNPTQDQSHAACSALCCAIALPLTAQPGALRAIWKPHRLTHVEPESLGQAPPEPPPRA